MHVLTSTWAFRLMQFPNGIAKRFKTYFCVHGNMQIEGVGFFETWTPVIQRTSVCSMMVLVTHIQLISSQADITATFVHAPLGPNGHNCVHQPADLHCDGDLVLELKKSVYGICQSHVTSSLITLTTKFPPRLNTFQP